MLPFQCYERNNSIRNNSVSSRNKFSVCLEGINSPTVSGQCKPTVYDFLISAYQTVTVLCEEIRHLLLILLLLYRNIKNYVKIQDRILFYTHY